MRKKNGIFFSIFIAAMVFVIGNLWYTNACLQQISQIKSSDEVAASSIRDDIIRRISICKSASKALSTVVQLYINDSEGDDISTVESNFLKIAEAVDNKYGSMNRIQLTKNNYVLKVYPDTEENRELVNSDLNSRIPKDRIEIFKNTSSCFVSGPVDTSSGWKGIIVRNSIFTEDAKGENNFWGSAGIMIKIDDLIKELQLNNLKEKKIEYHLYSVDAKTKANTMLASSDNNNFKNKITTNIITFDSKNKLVLDINDMRLDELQNTAIIMLVKLSAISLLIAFATYMVYIQREKLVFKAKINAHKLKEAKEYDRIKTEFFANLSHEFRTPINIILSAIKMLEVYMPEENGNNSISKIIEYKNIIKKNCYRLLRIIGNLIDVTKLDVNFLELNLVKVNIVSLVEDITLSVAKYCESKSVQLVFDTDIEEKYTMCDQDKIDRIMLNLLSNAIKFTNEGDKIQVNLYDKEEYVEISVRDTGIGIPKDKQKMIFERFRQVNKSLSREHEGSGIGLSLVKSLVELHGGTIRLNSEENNGSEFVFTIPIKLEDSNREKEARKLNNRTSKNLVETINIEFSDIL